MDCPYEAGRTVSFPEGRIELDGARALEYARARQGDCGGDFGRALRQQAVVAGLKSKVLAPSELWRAPWRGADVVRALQTDIGTIDMVKMGWLQARLEQRTGDRILLSRRAAADRRRLLRGADRPRPQRARDRELHGAG